MPLTLPFVPGRRLVDVVNELELRLAGSAPGPGLHSELAARIPDASSYALVLFDGLGHHQLDHPDAVALSESVAGVVAAPFPTTTTVSMATIATGIAAQDHGMISHLMWLPSVGAVVNVLKWVILGGSPAGIETSDFLPAPNTWERLRAAGIEPITVQPVEFERTPLTRALYRGCRYEGVASVHEAVEATADLVRQPRRLVFTYFPQLDFAAHVWGQRSAEYRQAMGLIDGAWSRLRALLPASAGLLGTADHGHLDYREGDKVIVRDRRFDHLTFFGDPRVVFVRGPARTIIELGSEIGVEPHWVDRHGGDLWPGGTHPELGARLPDAILAAPSGRVLIPKGFDKRLVGYHGGLDPGEVEIPVLVG